MALAALHETWKGGSLGKDQGRYGIASDWSGGVVPQPGYVLTINGVVNSGIAMIGQVITFPIGSGYTSVYLFPQPPQGQPINDPAALKGYTITGQTIDFNGTDGIKGADQIWLQQTTLAKDTLNVTGTTVFETYLNDSIGGRLNIGTAQGSGLLQMILVNADTAGVGIPGQISRVVRGGLTTIHAGSQLQVESLAQGGGIVEQLATTGTIDVAAGGTLVIDDTDGSGILTGADNNTNVINTGTIMIEGGAGHTTSASITAGLVSAGTAKGTIEVAGHAAARNATTLTLNGNVTAQHIILDDGVISINDAQLVIDDPTQHGFAVTGGSFTFGADGGTLLLHQPPLTTLQFVDHDTEQQQRPDGQHPFTTPIFNFGQGDTIGLVEAAYPGTHYVTVWDQAKNLLSVEMPAGIKGYPPEIQAQFTLKGTYSAGGFHLSANSQTQLLSLTYAGAHGS